MAIKKEFSKDSKAAIERLIEKSLSIIEGLQ